LKKPTIFNYNNFRTFLWDYFKFKNDQEKTFSKAEVYRRLGLPNSRSYFNDVVNGKFVSKPKINLFIKLCDFSKDEAVFFRTLVNFNQAYDEPDEKELLFDSSVRL